MTTSTDTPKIYTKEEIEAFTGPQLETFATKLRWHYDLQRYKTNGYPPYFGSSSVTSRKQFLILRVKGANQSTWNPAMKKVEDAAKKAAKEAAEKLEAAKPKVVVTTKVSIQIELKDRRPNGHVFLFEREDDSFSMTQKQGTGTRVGKRVCTASIRLKVKDFEKFTKALPHVPQINGMALTLGDKSHSMNIELEGDIVYVSEVDRYGSLGKSEKWHFNLADLQQVGSALATDYEFVAVPRNLTELS